MPLKEVLEKFNIDSDNSKITVIHSGLINGTWKITGSTASYILQKVNDAVFKKPESIAKNLSLIGKYLKQTHPDYLLPLPVVSAHGEEMVYIENVGYYRLFPFIADTHSIEVVSTPEEAYEAANQFGRFTSKLSDWDSSQLAITIPHFHDLEYRYKNFIDTCKTASTNKLKEAANSIDKIQSHESFVATYRKIVTHQAFKHRATHHDTKISNVLFNSRNKGVCVIDLDTLMPGYFISDVGDMMRTYLCPVSEEATDFEQIEVRPLYYEAIIRGYNQEMNGFLSPEEQEHFFYAGCFIIYMQAIRFLDDYLNNDVYYKTSYPLHNLLRAKNQLTLLENLLAQKNSLKKIR